jgi:hypothetical protein
MAFASPLGIALALRNLWLYGDLTGFAAFDQLHRLAPVDHSFAGFVRALVSVPNHFWLVWWKGSDVGTNGLLIAFYWGMAAIVAIAWGGLCMALWRWSHEHAGEVAAPHPSARYMTQHIAMLAPIYVVTILLYSVAVMSSYYQGMVPIIQGRFLLPAMVPFILLLVWGLWLYPHGEQMLLAVAVVLWGMGLCSLFGNLIPYFYYWSEVRLGTMSPLTDLSGEQWLVLVYQRAMQDKPAWLAPLLFALPVFYGLTLLFALIVTFRAVIQSWHWFGGGGRLPANPQR